MSTKIIKVNNYRYVIISNDKSLTNKLRFGIKNKYGYLKNLKLCSNKIEHNSFVIFMLTNIQYEQYIKGSVYETKNNNAST